MDEAVALLELGADSDGAVVTAVLELERSQLKGDLLTGGGRGCGTVAGGMGGAGGGSGAGGFPAGISGDTPLEVVVEF